MHIISAFAKSHADLTFGVQNRYSLATWPHLLLDNYLNVYAKKYQDNSFKVFVLEIGMLILPNCVTNHAIVLMFLYFIVMLWKNHLSLVKKKMSYQP